MSAQWRIFVLNGPNLNLLGLREPALYGGTTLASVEAALIALGRTLDVDVECFQSNHEGALIDALHERRGELDALIINPGGYTHTSVALRDAVLALDVPTYEVHVTNVYRREAFRHASLVADVAEGRLMGFGVVGYTLALRGAVARLSAETNDALD